MAAITIFRGLLLAALAMFAVAVATGAMSFFEPGLPVAVQNYLAQKSVGTLSNVFSEANLGTRVAVVIMMAVYLIAVLAALIGLLRFRGWARWLFIIVTSLTLVLLASRGTTLLTPIMSLVWTVGAMVSGAILTLLFIEPIRQRFRREPPTPAGPVDPLDPTEPET